jgi:hypothetical protein
LWAHTPRLPRGSVELPDPNLCPRCAAVLQRVDHAVLCPNRMHCPPQVGRDLMVLVRKLDEDSRKPMLVPLCEEIEQGLAALVAAGAVETVAQVVAAGGVPVRTYEGAAPHVVARLNRAVAAVATADEHRIVDALRYPERRWRPIGELLALERPPESAPDPAAGDDWDGGVRDPRVELRVWLYEQGGWRRDVLAAVQVRRQGATG